MQQSERGFPRQPFGSVMWIACPFPAWAKRPTRPNFRRPAGTSDREDGTKNRRRQNDRVLALLVSSTRPVNGPLSVHNTRSAFGRVSRYAHWVVGTLILALLPLGLFTWVLGPDHPEHGAFLAMHQTLGLTVLLLVVLRLLWLGQSPAQRQLALVTHRGLCALMLNFPVTGILLTAWRGDAMDIYGWSVAGFLTPDAHLGAAAGVVHNLVLAAMFYLALFAHLGAVTKHHFIDRRPQDIRRMLR